MEPLQGCARGGSLFASSKRLNSLVAIVDFNGWQGIGRTKSILNLDPFSEKWKSFGWNVKTINGHSHRELYNCLKKNILNLLLLLLKRLKAKAYRLWKMIIIGITGYQI